MVISFFMPLTPHIQSCIDYLKYQKRYSRHTLVSYETDLVAFFDYMEVQYGESRVEKVSTVFVRSWLASLKDSGISSKTINRKISSLKTFFKYLLRQEVVTVTPMTTVISPKTNKRLPQFVEMSDMNTLFQTVEFPGDWNGQTERLVMTLFYNTGIRQAELIGLKEYHVDISNSTIKVLGKGSKERVIPVSAAVVSQIRHYLAEKKSLPQVVDPGFLLVNSKGRKLYPKYVYLIVKKYLALVTTIHKKSPHILRHTFATHLTNSGADLNAVKELLGHSSLASTQVYTHNTIEKLKDIHKKAHPKA